jgi:hypothetical protein
VQLVFVVFVRTDLFVEQNRRTKTQYVGPLRNKKIRHLLVGNIKIDNKKNELNYRKFDVLDFFAIDFTVGGQIKLGQLKF